MGGGWLQRPVLRKEDVVYETLIQIEEAFTEGGVAERQWSLAERVLYLKLLVKRVDKLREIKSSSADHRS